MMSTSVTYQVPSSSSSSSSRPPHLPLPSSSSLSSSSRGHNSSQLPIRNNSVHFAAHPKILGNNNNEKEFRLTLTPLNQSSHNDGDANSVESGSDTEDGGENGLKREGNDSPPTLEDLSEDEGQLSHIAQSISFSRSSDDNDFMDNGIDLDHHLEPDLPHLQQSQDIYGRYSGNLRVGIASTEEDDDIDENHGIGMRQRSDYLHQQHRMPSAGITSIEKPRGKVSHRNQLNNMENIVLFFKYFSRYDKPKLMKAFRRIQRLHEETKIFTVNVEQYGLTSMLLELLQEYTIGGVKKVVKIVEAATTSPTTGITNSSSGSLEEIKDVKGIIKEINNRALSRQSSGQINTDKISTDATNGGSQPDVPTLPIESPKPPLDGQDKRSPSKQFGNEDIVIELLKICNELVILPTSEQLDAKGRDSLGINPRDVYHALNVFAFIAHEGLHIVYKIIKYFVKKNNEETTFKEREIMSLLLRFTSALGSTHECHQVFNLLGGCGFLMNDVVQQFMHDPWIIAEACQVLANMSLDETNRQQFLTLRAYEVVEDILFVQKKECRVVECACNALTALTVIPILNGDISPTSTISSNPATPSRVKHHAHQRSTGSDSESGHENDSMGLSRAMKTPQHHYHMHRPMASETTCELLVDVLNEHKDDDKPVISICKALVKLANHAEVVNQLAKAGCCELIVEVCCLHKDFPEVLEHAILVIQKLAIISEHRRVFGQKKSQSRASARIPSGMQPIEDDNDDDDSTKSGCEILVKLMKTYRHNRYLMSSICRAIRYLAQNRENQMIFGSLGVCELLTMVLKLHQDRRDVLEHILSAIWSMSTSVEEYQQRFGKRDQFCESLIEIMKMHRNDSKIIEQGCGVIKNLALQQELRLKLGLLRCCELLAEIVRYYGHCPLQPPSSNTHGNGNAGSQTGSSSGTGTAVAASNQRNLSSSSPLTRSALAKLSHNSNSLSTVSNSGTNLSDKGSQSGTSSAPPVPQHHGLNRGPANPERRYNPRLREREREKDRLFREIDNDTNSMQSPRDYYDNEPSTPTSVSHSHHNPNNYNISAQASDGTSSRRHSFNSQTSDTNSFTPSQPGTTPYRPLTQGELDVLEQCLWAIWNLATNSDNEKKFGRLHVCNYITFIIKHNADSLQLVEPCCGVVKNLSVNKENIVKFVSLNMCELLVELLSRYGSIPGYSVGNGVVRTSMSLIASSSSSNTAAASLLGHHHEYDMGRVISWQHHQLDITKQICCAIRNLAMFSEDTCLRFGRNGCCEILVNFAKLMLLTSNISSSSSICGITSTSNNRQSVGNNRTSQRYSGGSHTSGGSTVTGGDTTDGTSGSSNGYYDMLTTICLTITHLSRPQDNQKKFGHAGACSLLVDMTISYREKPSILEKIFQGMKALSVFPENQMLLGEANACQMIVDVMRIHIGNVKITEFATGCIRNLSDMPVNKERLGQDGACEVLIEILKLHRSRVFIVNEVIHSLYNLSFNDKNRSILSKMKMVDLANTLKGLHVKDQEIVKCCDLLIEKIKGKKLFGLF